MEHLKILPKKYNQHYRKITIKFKTGTSFVPEAKELKMEPLMEAKVFSDDVANVYPSVPLYKFTPFLVNFSKKD